MEQDKKPLVGKPTGRKSTADKETYITPEGEEVSEKSVSFPIRLENKVVWVNAPSIYNGVQHTEEEVRDKINSGEVKATSVHESREEAEEAAKKRSEGLLKNYDVGGVVSDAQAQGSTSSGVGKTNENFSGRLTYGNDDASFTPSVSYNKDTRQTEFEDGVILNETGKRIGLALNGEVKLDEGVKLRGGIERVTSSSSGVAVYKGEEIGGYEGSSVRRGENIGMQAGKLNLDYSQSRQEGTPTYKKISGSYDLSKDSNISGDIDNNNNVNIRYNKRYAKGGNVEQMNKLFADGGMMDDRGEQVNGVEVPPGSLREEVADDIPAQLSEGEFVVPADVVRYIGLEKLMAMRDKAKQGLKRMEEMGQMGNADEVANPDQTFSEQGDEDFAAEIDDIMAEEGEGYAKGGEVTADNVEKFEWARNPAVDVRYFKHEDGRVMFITYINGRPTTAIPEGFKQTDTPVEKLVGKAADDKATTTAPPDSGGGGDRDFDDGRSADAKGTYSDFLSTPIGRAVARAVNALTPGPSTQAPAPKVNLSTPLGVTPARGKDDSAPVVSSQDPGPSTTSGETSGSGPGTTSGSTSARGTGVIVGGPIASDVPTATPLGSLRGGGGSRSIRGGGGGGGASDAPGATDAAHGTDVDASEVNTDAADPGAGGDGGGGGGGGDLGTHICTASYNVALITPTHFKSLKHYGVGLRKRDPYLMRAYDAFGPKLASYVGKSGVADKAAKFLTAYYTAVQTKDSLSATQKVFSYVSDYILRPTYRIIGWVLIKFVDKK